MWSRKTPLSIRRKVRFQLMWRMCKAINTLARLRRAWGGGVKNGNADCCFSSCSVTIAAQCAQRNEAGRSLWLAVLPLFLLSSCMCKHFIPQALGVSKKLLETPPPPLSRHDNRSSIIVHMHGGGQMNPLTREPTQHVKKWAVHLCERWVSHGPDGPQEGVTGTDCTEFESLYCSHPLIIESESGS